MSQKQLTRQELYDEIKKSSKDAFILKEMKELGFWDSSKPQVAQELIERKVELQKELNQLSTKIRNPEAVIKEIHKQRMQEAMQRREAIKQRREQEEQAKIAQRKTQKENEIGFIGRPFISNISKKESNEQLLLSNNLFVIQDAKDLAQKMGVSLRELRFLTYTEKLSKHAHYVHFKMVKKSRGYREISSPKPQLKRLQYWILDNILNKVAVSDEAHGFIPKRNILSNALPHTQKSVVINADLENFFPTIEFGRVKGLFKSLGYSVEIATLLALLTTEAELKEVMLDGEKLYLETGRRYLPQGSPASPMITNLICRKLDKRLKGIAQTLGFEYTRYADDMTFSALEYSNINKMLYWLKKIVMEEGFVLHPEKTRIMKKGSRQEVTGVVVNEKPSINQKELKKFRALLYQIEQSGFEGKSWQGKTENLISVILGYAHFVKMIDFDKGAKFLAQIEKICQKYHCTSLPYVQSDFREKSAKGETPWKELPKADSEADKSDKKEQPTATPSEKIDEAPAKTEESFVSNILNMFRK
jgi:retron-type reverse transcriptase